MTTIMSQKAVYFDIDQTLLMFNAPLFASDRILELPNGVKVSINRRHIDAMKQHKARGHTIIVWSAGGWEWADRVVALLDLGDVVDVVMSKPDWFYDDKPASEFMPEANRVYYE